MYLSQLITAKHDVELTGPDDPVVTDIVVNPACAGPGSMYVAALLTMSFDGHDHLRAAIDKGPAVIVARSPRPAKLSPAVTWCQAGSPDSILGEALSRWHGRPSEALEVLAVTGTNGKTTTTFMLRAILEQTGHVPATIGTLGAHWRGEHRPIPRPFTTPPAPILQPLLAELVEAGVSHVAMEATNHALAIGRMVGTRVRVGGFTNLSRDHLDFHGDIGSYRDAKQRLFHDFAQSACFNIDDSTGRSFASAYSRTKLTVSQVATASADLVAQRVELGLTKTSAWLATPWGRHRLVLPLLGRHNLENALVALGMAVLGGVPLESAIAALAQVSAPRGRGQWVPGSRRVIVDYAHTPEALARVLDELRPHTTGRLITVFGAGGDRDGGKRAQMGAAVAERAELVFVTTDNPRDEQPEDIARQIVAGMSGAARHHVELDRRAAIRRAIEAAEVHDIVLIAGKGHEAQLELDARCVAHDDFEIARELMRSSPRPASAVEVAR